jgi:hypothetical protein
MTSPMTNNFKQPFATEVQPEQVGDDPKTAAELRKAQEEEYGKYVAATRIEIDGVLAFMPGHPVPAGHVSDDGPVYPSQVVPRDKLAPEASPPAKTTTKS